MRLMIIGCMLLFSSLTVQADSPFVQHQTDNSFETVMLALEQAITERGLSFSEQLHISEMLNRTGPDLNISQNIYQRAEIVTFCSAQLAHQMTQADPQNIAICPFAVTVYQTLATPAQVTILYRIPQLINASPELQQSVNALYAGIVQDVLAFW